MTKYANVPAHIYESKTIARFMPDLILTYLTDQRRIPESINKKVHRIPFKPNMMIVCFTTTCYNCQHMM